MIIEPGSTDVTIEIFIPDSTSENGGGKTGLLYNTSGLSAYYIRTRTTPQQINLVTQTVDGAHADGGFVEIDSTNFPGLYRLDLPDAIFASGAQATIIRVGGSTGTIPFLTRIEIKNLGVDITKINGAVITGNGASIPWGAL
jgi:hypothetical protein